MIFGNHNIGFSQINNNRYSPKLIFERKFNSGEDFFALQQNSNGNSVFKIHAGAPFRLSYNIPALIHVDDQNNYFLIYDSVIRIYDKDKRNIMSFEIPKDYNLDFIKSDKQNIYFYYGNYALSKKTAYKLNITGSEYVEMNQEAIENLAPSLKPPADEKESAIQRKNSLILDGRFYGISLGNAKSSIFKNENGFYYNPSSIYINRYDASFDVAFASAVYEEEVKLRIPSEYRYDSLSISSLFTDKIVYLNGWYTNQKGDIYFTGIKSNETSNRVKGSNDNVLSIDIIDPTFVFYKLENISENEK